MTHLHTFFLQLEIMLLISVKIHPSHLPPHSYLFHYMIVGWRQRTYNDRHVEFIKENIEFNAQVNISWLKASLVFMNLCIKIPPQKGLEKKSSKSVVTRQH